MLREKTRTFIAKPRTHKAVQRMGQRQILDENLRAFLRQEVGRIAKVSLLEIDDSVGIQDYGLTSLEVVILSGKIEDTFNIEIDPVEILRFSSIDGICLQLFQRDQPK